MTDRKFIQFLKRKQGDKSVEKFAAEIGVCRAAIYHIYNGNRPVGPTVLQHFGYRRAVAHIEKIK